MKNPDLISDNLREAVAQLQKTIDCLASGQRFGTRVPQAYTEQNLEVDLHHAQHHINVAWHIRQENRDKIIACAPEDFELWSRPWSTEAGRAQ